MTHISRRTLGLGAAAAASLSAPAIAQSQARSYVLTTATTGGTYYPVGVALATLAKVRLQNAHGLDMSAISSAGSTENVKLLRENQAQFAILQGLVAMFAARGTGPFTEDGPQNNLRGLLPLWFNFDQFVIDRRFATTGHIDDLKNLYGQRYSMGARGSGLETMHLWLFPNLGIEHERFVRVYLGYGPSAEGLQNGTVQGANFEAGLPTGSLTQAMAAAGQRLSFLEFNEEETARANGGGTLLTRDRVPGGTYPNLPDDKWTIKLPNYFACNADVPEEDVYLVVKTIFENLPFLNNIHAATREISLEGSVGAAPFVLHPGAIRYYRERGLTVPASLIPA